jgi:hypothetical protein
MSSVSVEDLKNIDFGDDGKTEREYVVVNGKKIKEDAVTTLTVKNAESLLEFEELLMESLGDKFSEVRYLVDDLKTNIIRANQHYTRTVNSDVQYIQKSKKVVTQIRESWEKVYKIQVKNKTKTKWEVGVIIGETVGLSPVTILNHINSYEKNIVSSVDYQENPIEYSLFDTELYENEDKVFGQ